MGLPTLDDLQERPRDGAKNPTRSRPGLLSWLPRPPSCPDCGELLMADVSYHPRLVRRVPSWTCEDCDVALTRNPAMGPLTRPPPVPGSGRMADLLRRLLR